MNSIDPGDKKDGAPASDPAPIRAPRRLIWAEASQPNPFAAARSGSSVSSSHSAGTDPPYEIIFYSEDESDEEGPVWRWIQSLDMPAQRAAIAALGEILAYQGVGVCRTEWGKPLGEGLFELRIRRPAKQIFALVGSPKAEEEEDSSEKLLLRIFFHAYGQRLIVLLGGYDKLERPSEHHQQQQIAIARKRLKEWKKRH